MLRCLNGLFVYADLKAAWSKPWVPRLLCGVLLLFTMLEIALGLLAFFSSESFGDDKSSSVAIAAEPVPLDRKEVVDLPFFGDYMPDHLTEADVKRSALRLSVVGIIYSPQEEESHVLVQLPDKEERVFHIGDALPGGAVLKRIQPDSIFMMRNGAIESLSLPEKGLTFDAPAKPMGEE